MQDENKNSGNWSTSRVEQLLKKIDTDGIIPKISPFYARNTKLKAPEINFGYTHDELVERIRCEQDIFFFAENYCNVMTDEGIRVVKMRKYQKRVLHDFDKYRFNIFLASRQIGKCVSAFTKVRVRVNGKIKKIAIYKVFYKLKPRKTFIDYKIYVCYFLAQLFKRQNRLLSVQQ